MRKPTPRKAPRSSYPKPPATAAPDFGASAKTDWFAQRRMEKEAKEEAKQQAEESRGVTMDVLDSYLNQVEDILKQLEMLSDETDDDEIMLSAIERSALLAS